MPDIHLKDYAGKHETKKAPRREKVYLPEDYSYGEWETMGLTAYLNVFIL